MKVIQNQKLLLAAAMGIILSFSSCKKYEDGPALSFRTKTSRLVGDWTVVKVDGQKLSESGTLINIDFDKGGDFAMASSYFSFNGPNYSTRETGEWEWENGKEEIEIETGRFKEDWEILRLTNKELWFEIENGQKWKCEKN